MDCMVDFKNFPFPKEILCGIYSNLNHKDQNQWSKVCRRFQKVHNEFIDYKADRTTAIQRCTNTLVHACQCWDPNCQSPSCNKMKRVVAHTRQCTQRSIGGCPICQQLIALCCYHARVCHKDKCSVHFCQNIKGKFREQKLQQRLQKLAMIKRRIAQMKARMNLNQDNPN